MNTPRAKSDDDVQHYVKLNSTRVNVRPDARKHVQAHLSADDHGDLDLLVTLLGSPEVMAFYPRPKTRDEVADWIAWNECNYARDGFGLWLLHDHDGAFVGECGLTWQQVDGKEDLEVGYHVLPEHQGLGFATEAAEASRELARVHGIPKLIAIIRPENHASRRVAEKLGLTVEKTTFTSTGMEFQVHSTRLR